jgi:hypothetical protein
MGLLNKILYLFVFCAVLLVILSFDKPPENISNPSSSSKTTSTIILKPKIVYLIQISKIVFVSKPSKIKSVKIRENPVRQEAFVYQLVKFQPVKLTVRTVVRGTVKFRGGT